MTVGSCLSDIQVRKIYKILEKNNLNVLVTQDHRIPIIGKGINLTRRQCAQFKHEGNTIANEILKLVQNDQPVHVELGWYMQHKYQRHAMGLIYFPKKHIEFFDPSGYEHIKQTNYDNYDADKVMFHVIEGIKDILNVPLLNLSTRSINPGGHCNAWTIYFHMLRHLNSSISTNVFKNKYMKKWDTIANANTKQKKLNKESEIYGPVHKVFLDPKNSILNNILKI